MSAREEFRSSSFRTRTGSLCRGSGAFRFLVAHCRLSEQDRPHSSVSRCTARSGRPTLAGQAPLVAVAAAFRHDTVAALPWRADGKRWRKRGVAKPCRAATPDVKSR